MSTRAQCSDSKALVDSGMEEFLLHQKIPQQLQAAVLTFFWVELHGPQVIADDGGGESFLVISHGGDDAGIDGRGEIRMNEIEIRLGLEARPARMLWVRKMRGIPSHVRDFFAGLKADDLPLQDAQTSDAWAFFTTLEQQLITDADAEKWNTSRNVFSHGFRKPTTCEFFHRIAKRTDARQNDARGIFWKISTVADYDYFRI